MRAHLQFPFLWLALLICPAALPATGDVGESGSGEGLEEVLEAKAPDEPENYQDAEQLEQSVGGYAYWDDGWHITGPREAVELLWNAKLDVDFGNIDADPALQEGFPGLAGEHRGVRRANLALLGEWEEKLQFKIEADFADAKSIKDEWIRFLFNPFLSRFTFGHMKEPYSLELLTSATYATYMERPLAAKALGPSRNIGVSTHGAARERRLTWAGGLFLNTGSFSDQGEAREQITNSNGYNFTGRVTWLPRLQDGGRRLVHLGASYSHRVRTADPGDVRKRYRTRPESYLTDDRLVDTGEMFERDQRLINLEAAWTNGPMSLQGELFWNRVIAEKNLNFYGYYLSGSYVLTGEHRAYRRSGGVFGSITPKRPFQPWKGGWGAVELALRFSAVDLNDDFVQGGKERNITLGFNWYLQRKIRLMVNYIHANVQDRADPPIRDSDANILMARFQAHF